MNFCCLVPFKGVKTDNFHWKKMKLFLFLLKTYVYIVGTRKNRLIEAVLTSAHNKRFRAKIESK